MLEVLQPRYRSQPASFSLPPIKLYSSSGSDVWEVPLTPGCVNHDGGSPWFPNDVNKIEVPAGGIISLYGQRDCGGSDTWVGSGETDLGILGLRNNLYSLRFVRWTEEAPGPSPFQLTDRDGNTKDFPARNDVVNFGDPFPDNSLRVLVIPDGYAAHVFDDVGCRFNSANMFYDAGRHDLADDNFQDRASSIWLIRMAEAKSQARRR